MNKKFVTILLILLLGTAAIFIVDGALSVSQTVYSTGSIVAINLGVYSDSTCTVICSSVDWGILGAGSSVNRIVYVKNTGNTLEVLSLAVTNWNPPAASSYLSVTWNLLNFALAPGQVVVANLSLTVSPGIVDITNFTNTLTISGTST